MTVPVGVRVRVDTLNRSVHPRVHGLSCLAYETLGISVLLEAFNGLLEAFDRLLMVGIPRVQVAVGICGFHEDLQALIHRR